MRNVEVGAVPRCSRPIPARAAARFAELGLIEAATPLLERLGWDGRIDASPGGSTAGHQHSFDAAERHRFGIHYTPPAVADGLVRIVLDHGVSTVTVADPACGAGVFLVAAAEGLRRAGVPVDTIITGRLRGADRDRVAVDLTRLELALWAARHTGRFCPIPEDHLLVADALDTTAPVGWLAGDDRVDVVVGNPPFGSQLKGDTIRSRAERERLAGEFGIGRIGHADTAALFLLRSVELVGDGGTVCLILPTSVAAAQGSARIRAAVGARARPSAVWIAGGDVGFDASVNLFAPVFSVGDDGGGPVRRHRGVRVESDGTVPGLGGATNWAPLLADTPPGSVPGDGSTGPGPEAPRLGAVASTVAGFRQHFYGLAPHVRDDPHHRSTGPLLVTTGAVDPLHHRTRVPVRFAGRSWVRPVLDLDGLDRDDPSLAHWVRDLLVPKVLVASQGRVIEALVDPGGVMVPSTPTIAVRPRPDAVPGIWHIAAMLCDPRATARLHEEAGGTGLGVSTCRVTAGFLESLPQPDDPVAWDRAAEAARRASLAAECGDARTWSNELDRVASLLRPAGSDSEQAEALQRWWSRRRPGWRGARTLVR